MATIEFDEEGVEAKLGDTVELQGQDQEVVACEETGVLMLNIDADELEPGDLKFIKRLGLTISNPDTERPVALSSDYVEDSFGHSVKKYLESEDEDDDDDSSFFSSAAGIGLGLFGGHSSFGGFSGGGFSGFGGFGGGKSGGGGSSSSW